MQNDSGYLSSEPQPIHAFTAELIHALHQHMVHVQNSLINFLEEERKKHETTLNAERKILLDTLELERREMEEHINKTIKDMIWAWRLLSIFVLVIPITIVKLIG